MSKGWKRTADARPKSGRTALVVWKGQPEVAVARYDGGVWRCVWCLSGHVLAAPDWWRYPPPLPRPTPADVAAQRRKDRREAKERDEYERLKKKFGGKP